MVSGQVSEPVGDGCVCVCVCETRMSVLCVYGQSFFICTLNTTCFYIYIHACHHHSFKRPVQISRVFVHDFYKDK